MKEKSDVTEGYRARVGTEKIICDIPCGEVFSFLIFLPTQCVFTLTSIQPRTKWQSIQTLLVFGEREGMKCNKC